MEQKISISYETTTYDQLQESGLKPLIDETIAFAQNAYAPYSKFKVSAGLRLENGQIVKGTNVENASYPVSICAERNLLAHTVSNYPDLKIMDLAVYVDKDLPTPVPPCGMCRQTLAEMEQRQGSPIRIIMVAKNGDILILKSSLDLLPWSFNSSYLD